MKFPRLLFALTACTLLAACHPGAKSAPEAGPEARSEGSPGAAAKAAEPQAEAEPGVVTLDAATQESLRFSRAAARVRPLPMQHEAPGQIGTRGESETQVSAPMDGQVVSVSAGLGDRVAAGQVLATMSSSTWGEVQAEYLKARDEHALASRELKRVKRLLGYQLASKQEDDQAVVKAAQAKIALDECAEHLRAWGFSDAEIAKLAERHRVDTRRPIRAAQAGTVVERHVSVGQHVSADGSGGPLFRLVDLSRVRVEAELPERELLAVRPGQAASVRLAALPDARFSGRVVKLSPLLDPATRTGKALIDVANPNGLLKPGMSSQVTIALGARRALAVPAGAVQQEAGKSFVYKVEGPERFREAPVTLGPKIGDAYVVEAGLKAGEEVVVRGSFDLRSQARKALFGGEE